MAIQSEQVAHNELVGGSQTSLHSHAGGGSQVIKCGTATTDGNGNATVTFGTAFSDTSYSIVLTCAVGADTNITMYSNKATTGFGIKTENDQGQSEGNVSVDWVAIHV
jgi:hypothetical protein